MKTCTKCKETKDVSFFKKDPSSKDGLYSHCKPCLTDRDREYNRTQRMHVNGVQIPKSHPLWKPGRYEALDDAWSHQEIERTKFGQVYIISNPAWPNWHKIGKAVYSEDRLNNYQTSSPYRDYVLEYRCIFNDRHIAEKEVQNRLKRLNIEFLGEWFNTELETIKKVIDDVKQEETSPRYRNEYQPQFNLDLCY